MKGKTVIGHAHKTITVKPKWKQRITW